MVPFLLTLFYWFTPALSSFKGSFPGVTMMPDIEQQIADHLSNFVQNAMRSQSVRFREEWEPQIVRTLGGAADLCLLRLQELWPQLRNLPNHECTQARLQMILGRAFAPVVSGQAEAAKDILRRMVREESAAAGEALSLSGLAGTAPEIVGSGRGHDQFTDHLACCQELDQAVSASFVDVTGRVAAELADGTDEAVPRERLSLLFAAWRGSLERIARTTLHQSATLLRQAVGAALS
jgi:hypothetical protein